MKKLFSLLSVLLLFLGARAQDSYAGLGMPGDNLNLYVVLDAFKQASSLENFEKQLNDPSANINNLDLNNDGIIDYLKVTDYGKDNYHTIIIQDIISSVETQDVAVIDLQKNEGNVVHVQIVGDESLYGKNYIIEPQIETAKQNNEQTVVVNNTYYVNAWAWPSVTYIYGPAYSVWASPWHWAYYPGWWNPRPHMVYNVYYSHHSGFGWNHYCRRYQVINRPYYNNYYHSRRVVSNTVQVNITKKVYKNNAPRVAVSNNTNGNKAGSSNPKNNNSGWKKNDANGANNANNANNQTNPKSNPKKWNKKDNASGQGANQPANTTNGSNNTYNGQGNPKKNTTTTPKQNNPKWGDNTNTNNGNGNGANQGAGKPTPPISKPANNNNNTYKPANSGAPKKQNNAPKQNSGYNQNNNKPANNNGGFKGNNGAGKVNTSRRPK